MRCFVPKRFRIAGFKRKMRRESYITFSKPHAGTTVNVSAKPAERVTFRVSLLLIDKDATMTSRFSPLLLLLLFLAACKSASKSFNQGDYSDAVERSVRKLQKDPGDADATRILQAAYKVAVAQYEEKIRNLSSLNSETRWEQLFYQYQELQHLYDKINEAPAAMAAVQPVNYASYLETYGDKSAEQHVQKAISFMDEGADKLDFQKAYYELRTALTFKPGDDGILKKLADAKEAATVTVLLVPMDVRGLFRYNTSYAFRNFENNIIRSIRNGINRDFLRFITVPEGRNSGIEPDEITEMRLGNFNIGRPYDETSTRTVTKEVVVKEMVYSKDSVVKEYAKVKAQISTTRRTLVSTADLYLDIRNPQRLILWNDNVRAEHRWSTEFASFTGDERALSDSDKELLAKTQRAAPREDEIVDLLLRQLANNTTQRLHNYYDRY